MRKNSYTEDKNSNKMVKIEINNGKIVKLFTN